MGVPMSSRLVRAGFRVQAYDVSEDARAAFTRESGAEAVESLAACAAGVRAVVLMLPSSPIVRAVLLEDGLLEAMPPGSLVADMGSSEPVQTRELAEEAARRGVELVDAPVSGGVRGAVAGSLAIMFGGSEEQFEVCRPLLGQLGSKVLRAGPVGAGHALKALNNVLSATHLLVSAEAIRVGRRFGLDPQLMLDVINAATGRSYSTEYKLPTFVVPETYDAGFALRLMVKDMKTAVALARATGTATPLTDGSTELWERAAEVLAEDADHTEIARWLETLDD